MARIIFHIDVNNAFLSWSAVVQKKNDIDPRLVSAVVSGDIESRNSIVLAKSIKAKETGIKTGEPLKQALKKDPNLLVIAPDYDLYTKMSYQLFVFLQKYTPDIEICSIDECFIDYTPVKRLYGDEYQFAKKLQKEIFAFFGFTVNIGIANNKLCAKMASDLEKPNKINTIYENEVVLKMHLLPIERLFGVGQKTASLMRKIGINKISDLANYDIKKLKKYFPNQAEHFINMAWGIDDAEVIINSGKNKGISNSQTFEKDIDDEQILINKLYQLGSHVAFQLRQQDVQAYVIGIIIKDAFFQVKSHQKKIRNATNDTKEINEITKNLFLQAWDRKPVRLLGVKAEKLTNESYYQISFFENEEQKEKNLRLNETLDKLYQKYGHKVIRR